MKTALLDVMTYYKPTVIKTVQYGIDTAMDEWVKENLKRNVTTHEYRNNELDTKWLSIWKKNKIRVPIHVHHPNKKTTKNSRLLKELIRKF